MSRIDGRGYKAYRGIEGSYDFGFFQLFIDHVQADPFAAPSRLRVRVDPAEAAFSQHLYANRPRAVALRDFLTRQLEVAIGRTVNRRRGTGRSGLLGVDRPGQEVLERTSVIIDAGGVEARLHAGLPARGRTILGGQAEAMLCEELPKVVEDALLQRHLSLQRVEAHVMLAEDQETLRAWLNDMGLVAFVANGSVLPRESGVSNRPLRGEEVVPFQSPPSLEVEVTLPHRGPTRGMGVPAGVTLIVGGGYQGKSTLLRALERGVYNHIEGDGRELVITVPDAIKIRAEDGRFVEKVNVSPFINNLPGDKDTELFSTPDASGTTSQAANIMEALELGATCLLIDEDTSATNFMIRDSRMQELVAREKEPITPFIDRVRQLKEEKGISSVLVVGGSGDYLDVADTVIMMDEYRPFDVSARAREVSASIPTGRRQEVAGPFGSTSPRIPIPESFDASRGPRLRIRARGVREIEFGHQRINLLFLEQLVSESQTRAIADLILYAARRYVDGKRGLRQILETVMADIDEKGLDILSPFRNGHPGDYARPRLLECGGAINRLRSLKIKVPPSP